MLRSRALFSDQSLQDFLTPGPSATKSASEQHHLFPKAWLVKKGIRESKGYMSRIESGQRLPSVEVLDRIATRLGAEVRDLFIFPERGDVDLAMEKVRREAGPKRIKARSSRG